MELRSKSSQQTTTSDLMFFALQYCSGFECMENLTMSASEMMRCVSFPNVAMEYCEGSTFDLFIEYYNKFWPNVQLINGSTYQSLHCGPTYKCIISNMLHNTSKRRKQKECLSTSNLLCF